ncbi:MAG: PDZ domain-containing protein [Planctomycetota bacterium]
MSCLSSRVRPVGRSRTALCLWLVLFAIAPLSAAFGQATTSEPVPPRTARRAAAREDALRAELREEFQKKARELSENLARDVERMIEQALRRQREQLGGGDALATAERRIVELEAQAERLKKQMEELRAQLDASSRPTLRVAPSPTPVEPPKPAPPPSAPPIRRPGIMGVQLVPVEAEYARKLGLADDRGAQVVTVMPDSPAMRAGITAGDVITDIDGQAVSPQSVSERIAGKQAGEEVAVKYVRLVDGAPVRFELRMELAARDRLMGAASGDPLPSPPPLARPIEVRPVAPVAPSAPTAPSPSPTVGTGVRLGATVRQELDFRLVITMVHPGGNAAVAGLKEGDVLEQVAGKQVKTLDSLKEVLAGIAPQSQRALTFLQGSSRMTIELLWAGEGETPRVVSKVVSLVPASTPTPVPAPAERRPGRLGIEGEEAEQSVRVVAIQDGTAASKMGLKVGDRIIELNGQRTKNMDDLRAALTKLSAGAAIELKVARGSETQLLKGTLGSVDPAAPSAAITSQPAGVLVAATNPAGKRKPYVGIQVEEPLNGGALRIVSVDAGSPAAQAGFKVGDVLAACNGTSVKTLASLRTELDRRAPGEKLEAAIERAGKPEIVQVILGVTD